MNSQIDGLIMAVNGVGHHGHRNCTH